MLATCTELDVDYVSNMCIYTHTIHIVKNIVYLEITKCGVRTVILWLCSLSFRSTVKPWFASVIHSGNTLAIQSTVCHSRF